MYTIHRKERIRDELRLVDNNKELIVPVEIDIDKAISEYWRLYEELYLAQEICKKDPSDVNQEQFGNAFIVLLVFLFGEEWAHKILNFYENRYSEALTDLYPYIGKIIYPKLKEESEARARAMKGRRK